MAHTLYDLSIDDDELAENEMSKPMKLEFGPFNDESELDETDEYAASPKKKGNGTPAKSSNTPI